MRLREVDVPDEYRTILIFAVRNQEVASLSYCMSCKEGLQFTVKSGLGLTFGKSKPIPNPDEYVVVDWDTLRVVPKKMKISKISESGIVILLPNMPIPKLRDEALKYKAWIMGGEMRHEVDRQLELQIFGKLIQNGKIK